MTKKNINKATEVGIEYVAEQAFDMLEIYYLDRERELAFHEFLYLFIGLREGRITLAFILIEAMLRGVGEDRFAALLEIAFGEDVDMRDCFIEAFDEEQKQYWLGHTNIHVTLGMYADVYDRLNLGAIEKFETFMDALDVAE